MSEMRFVVFVHREARGLEPAEDEVKEEDDERSATTVRERGGQREKMV